MVTGIACIPLFMMEAVDGIKHIVKEGSERRNEGECPYDLGSEELGFLAEQRKTETNQGKEGQPDKAEKLST
jgi:hypothetical protein